METAIGLPGHGYRLPRSLVLRYFFHPSRRRETQKGQEDGFCASDYPSKRRAARLQLTRAARRPLSASHSNPDV